MGRQKSEKLPTPDAKILAADLKNLLSGKCVSFGSEYNALFYCQTYSRLCLELLKKCRITPDIVNFADRLYLMNEGAPASALILIDRKMKIKDIILLTQGFRPALSEFTDDIAAICADCGVKRCAVIYNFIFKGTKVQELIDMNKLYCGLKDYGILLTDAVQFAGGKAESVMLPYDKSGYNAE